MMFQTSPGTIGAAQRHRAVVRDIFASVDRSFFCRLLLTQGELINNRRVSHTRTHTHIHIYIAAACATNSIGRQPVRVGDGTGSERKKRKNAHTRQTDEPGHKCRVLVVREGRDGRRYGGVWCVRARLLAAYRRPTRANRRHDGRARPRGIPHRVSAAADRQCAQNAFLAVNDRGAPARNDFSTLV